MTRPRWQLWFGLGLVVLTALVVAMMIDLSRAVTAGKDRIAVGEATYPSFFPMVRNDPPFFQWCETIQLSRLHSP